MNAYVHSSSDQDESIFKEGRYLMIRKGEEVRTVRTVSTVPIRGVTDYSSTALECPKLEKRLESLVSRALLHGLNEEDQDAFCVYMKQFHIESHYLESFYKSCLMLFSKRTKRTVLEYVELFNDAFVGKYEDLKTFGKSFLEEGGHLSGAPDEFVPYIDFEKWAKLLCETRGVNGRYYVGFTISDPTSYSEKESILIFSFPDHCPTSHPQPFIFKAYPIELEERNWRKKVPKYHNNAYDELKLDGKLVAPFESFAHYAFGVTPANLDMESLEDLVDEFRNSFLGKYSSIENFGMLYMKSFMDNQENPFGKYSSIDNFGTLYIKSFINDQENLLNILFNTNFTQWNIDLEEKGNERYHYAPSEDRNGVYIFSKKHIDREDLLISFLPDAAGNFTSQIPPRYFW